MKKVKLNLIMMLFKLNYYIKTIDNGNYKKLRSDFKKHYNEIDKRVEAEKGTLAFHRMISIIGLALYKSLQDKYDSQEELIEVIHNIMWKGRMENKIRFVAFFIRHSKNTFRNFLKILGPNNEWFFPCPPWEKVSVEIENGIGWHQVKCPTKSFFEKEGVGELTRAYCDMDERIVAFLPDHVELKREKTLCKGDDYCDFLYYRK